MELKIGNHVRRTRFARCAAHEHVIRLSDRLRSAALAYPAGVPFAGGVDVGVSVGVSLGGGVAVGVSVCVAVALGGGAVRVSVGGGSVGVGVSLG